MKEKAFKPGHEFLRLRKIEDLSFLLGMSESFLKAIALNPEYTTFKIPKKTGGYRTIEAPSPVLKKIQKNLNSHLQRVYLEFRPGFVHGFIKKSKESQQRAGIISNASAHVSKSNIMTLDLEDFFHSFKAKDIWSLFTGYPFNFHEPLANLLTMVTTWYDILPMGSPTSPVLSNFLMLNLDHELATYIGSRNGVYTRYADDMTFSFNEWIPEEIIKQITGIIKRKGFRINTSKFRIQRANIRQTVTGLVVNRRVNINRRYIRHIRAVLFDWRANGIDWATRKYYKLSHYPDSKKKYHFQKSVQGRIEHIGHVRGKDDQIYWKLHEQLLTIRNIEN